MNSLFSVSVALCVVSTSSSSINHDQHWSVVRRLLKVTAHHLHDHGRHHLSIVFPNKISFPIFLVLHIITVFILLYTILYRKCYKSRQKLEIRLGTLDAVSSLIIETTTIVLRWSVALQRSHLRGL